MTALAYRLVGLLLAALAGVLLIRRARARARARDFDLCRTPPRAELRRIRRWRCPACGEPFGKRSEISVSELENRANLFQAYVDILCRHCLTFNFFDSSGNPGIKPPGQRIGPVTETFEEMKIRLDLLAQGTACPGCGAVYLEWSGSEFCRAIEKIEGAPASGPIFRVMDYEDALILCCSECGKSAVFLDRGDRLEQDLSFPVN